MAARKKQAPPRSFVFVIEGKLAGMARPGSLSSLDADLTALRRKGIGAVVSLIGEKLDPKAAKKAGLKTLHLPIPDFSAPKPSQIDRFVKFVDEMLAKDVGVAVHCGTGSGRTGTMLASYLVSKGRTAEEAIAEIRSKRSSYVETREQEDAIKLYEARLARRKSSSACE